MLLSLIDSIPSKEYFKLKSKQERLDEFIKRLKKAKKSENADEAFNLIQITLNELTNILYNPQNWMTDGRLYLPQKNSERSTNNPVVKRYRSRGHNTLIGANGAILIEEVTGKTVWIDIPGDDRRKVSDL